MKSSFIKISIIIFLVFYIFFIEFIPKFSAMARDDDFQKYSVTVAEVFEMLSDGSVGEDEKIVFLTFDDGPSLTVTPSVLDTLKRENVKATFFLLGKNVDDTPKNKALVRRIYEEGHSIGNHTYTHNLKVLYPNKSINIDNYLREVLRTENSLKAILGEDFKTTLIRMPGGIMSRKFYGDPNLDKFLQVLQERSISNIDWNASGEDSEGGPKNAEQILNSVKATTEGQDISIILLHDTYGKEETAKALPKIIKYLKDQGYIFKVLK